MWGRRLAMSGHRDYNVGASTMSGPLLVTSGSRDNHMENLNYYVGPEIILFGSRFIMLGPPLITSGPQILCHIASIRKIFIPPRNEVRGDILDSPCLYVCPSVRLSVCPLTFRVRPVASTVPDGFFPYMVQMISSMRRCVACDNLWPWPISSRSFDLDLENRVRSVASTVLDGFFLYLAQMTTIIRGCVACYVLLKIWKFEFLAIF